MSMMQMHIEANGKTWWRGCDLAFVPRNGELVDAGDGLWRRVTQVYHSAKQTVVKLDKSLIQETDEQLERMGWTKNA